ncbi:MAG: hypothetical protein HKM04_07310, partial [Legionellales bacterium]|nr:hypothetical protein [Legionellales bacterium]
MISTYFKKAMAYTLAYGGVALEISYAYFVYTAIDQSFDEIAKNYGFDSNATELAFIPLSITLALLNLIEDVLSVNPAEEVYQKTHLSETVDKQDDQNLIEVSDCVEGIVKYPMKVPTFICAYSSFITGAVADSLSVAVLIPNKYLKWTISLLPIVLGTAYYHMLSYNDTIEHHNFIYKRLFSLKTSVLANFMKSPAVSTELILGIGSNMVLRSGLFSYAGLLFLQDEEFDNLNLNAIDYVYLIAFVFITTGYSTLFSRFIGSYNTYFNKEVEEYLLNNKNETVTLSKGSFIFNSILRIIR